MLGAAVRACGGSWSGLGACGVKALGAAQIGCVSLQAAPRRFMSAPRNTRRSVHKALRRQKWSEVRNALAYAARFDARGTTLKSVRQALQRLRWPVEENFAIAEGVVAPLAIRDRYLCFEVATPDDYVDGTSLLATETLARHSLIRRKGWKLVVNNARAWEKAAETRSLASGGRSGVASRVDLLTRLIVRQAPFIERQDTSRA
jgi:hypothetical protein